MTSDNVKKYLINPDQCPYCGSDYLTGGNPSFDHLYAWRDVNCDGCGKSWTEEFKLITAQEVVE